MLETTDISLDEIRPTAQKMLDEGWRFVTVTAVDLKDDNIEILYHYDKDLVMKHYRVRFPKGTPVPSISGIFFAALLVENENRDLFGLDYEGLILDFNKTLYLDGGETINAPFCKVTAVRKEQAQG